MREECLVPNRHGVFRRNHLFPRLVLPIGNAFAVADTCWCPDEVIDPHEDLPTIL